MNNRRSLFRLQAVLLFSVVIPLALAERTSAYLLLTVLGCVTAYWSKFIRKRPILSKSAATIAALLAFFFMTYEYAFSPRTAPVLALAHFMLLSCLIRWNSKQRLRDETQFVILCLLLLVIAAIVGGDLLFPIALVVYLTVGCYVLLRLHLLHDQKRITEFNQRIFPRAGSDVIPQHEPRALAGTAVWLSCAGMTIAVAVFLLSPRVGAGMFGQLPNHTVGPVVTGFSDHLQFTPISSIQQSDKPVMRVMIKDAQGTPFKPAGPLHFRGNVLTHYRRNRRSHKPIWGWQRDHRSGLNIREIDLQPEDSSRKAAPLLDLPPAPDRPVTFRQEYFLESRISPYIFNCYPPLEIEASGISELRKHVASQVLQYNDYTSFAKHYTIVSATSAGAVSEALAQERRRLEQPRVHLPSPALDREADIRELIEDAAGPPPEPGDVASRATFVTQLVDFLQDPDNYSYTLQPPPIPNGREPIGEFLLRTKMGHCEYFASALVVMCQLSGIPARVVNGYLTGDYNPVGQFFVVREKHAHSWAEVYIPGMDWVTFDPTPFSAFPTVQSTSWLARLRRQIDYVQFQWTNLIVSYDSQTRKELFEAFNSWLKRPSQNQRTSLGKLAAFIRELFGWRLELTARERLIYWVFSLLVLLLIVLLLYALHVIMTYSYQVIRRRIAQHFSQRRHDPRFAFYARFCRIARKAGFKRDKTQTPAEFAEQTALTDPRFLPAQELVQTYYAMRFGTKDLESTSHQYVQDIIENLRQT